MNDIHNFTPAADLVLGMPVCAICYGSERFILHQRTDVLCPKCGCTAGATVDPWTDAMTGYYRCNGPNWITCGDFIPGRPSAPLPPEWDGFREFVASVEGKP